MPGPVRRTPVLLTSAVAAAAAAAAAALVTATPAAAGAPRCTVTWVGPAVGQWEDGASWSTGTVPRHPRDRACVESATSVTVTTSRTVAEVSVGGARVVVAAGTVLTAAGQLTVGNGGALAGPGTVAPRFLQLAGRVALADGVRVVGQGGSLGRGATLTFTGGSVLDNTGQLTFGTAAALLDGDADPGNAFVQSQTIGGIGIVVTGGARIEVAATVTGPVEATDYDGRGDAASTLALPRLTNETTDGVLHGGIELRAFAPITVPYPVTVLRNAVVRGTDVRVGSTDEPALHGLRSCIDSTVTAYESLAIASALSLTRCRVLVYANTSAPVTVLSAPSITVGDASSLTVLYGASVVAGGGAGTVVLDRDTANGGGSVSIEGGVLDGSFVQRGGTFRVGASTVTGDLTLGAAATVAAQIDRPRSGRAQRPALVVQGSARLAGALTVTYQSVYNRPVVGTAIRFVTVGGGVTGTFAPVDLPAGWQPTYDRRGLVITRVS